MKHISRCKWALLLSILSLMNCDAFLDIQPEGSVIPKTLADFRGLMISAYDDIYLPLSIESFLALRTDDIKPHTSAQTFPSYRDIYSWRDATPSPDTKAFPYEGFYNVIFYVNHIINEGGKTIAAASEKEQLIGEAYALRAYVYFDLINLYGKPYRAETADTGVPLVLDVDLERNFKPQSVQQIYDRVLADLEEAKRRLHTTVPETGSNYRFSLLALYALEARVNLYMDRWESALQAADHALSLKKTLVNLNESQILPNAYTSPESILALANTYTLRDIGYPSDGLINLYDRADDLRFPLYFKYDAESGNYRVDKGGESNACSFRVAELYLIQSEALLHLDRLESAKKPLLVLIENRYKTERLPDRKARIKSMNQEAFRAELFAERRRELAFEGHRWFDLRRTTQPQITHVLSGKTYTLNPNDPRYTLPFPESARLRNPFLTHPGP